MPRSLDGLQRIGVKLFLDGGGERPEPRELVPIFHRWIQSRAIDQLLIDVADYSHLHEGPSVVLVAHEGNLALDLGGGRMGLQYYRKQPVAGPLLSRLVSLCRIVIRAASLLESDAALGGRVRFAGNELEFVANDRLLAPNDETAFAAMQAVLDPIAQRLYPGMPAAMTRNPDPRERLTVSVKVDAPVTIETVSDRLTDR